MPASSSHPPKVVAAIDLGSNSFHMIVARVTDEGRLHVLDRLKEMVRLAGGLDEHDRLDPATRERAIACLQRFGERLRDFPPNAIRAVGTNTLRRARDSNRFLEWASQSLGHDIEVITGMEEARLIYQGISHNLPDDHRQRLAIDIGGGSTEVIIGKNHKPSLMESLYLGCVSSSFQFFPDGRLTRQNMRRCVLNAMQEFEPLQSAYRTLGWDEAVGSSGTILSIASVLTSAGGSGTAITSDGLQQLHDELIHAGHVGEISLAGLQPERAPVFAGGVAILSGAFEMLNIRRMEAVSGALREGIIYDLLGRFSPADTRERTIVDLLARNHVDRPQASRVASTAIALAEQVADNWPMKDRHLDLLRWAASLHETGLSVAHAQYHKHGAYLIRHGDLPGFSIQEKLVIAGLVRAHRRKFPVSSVADMPLKQTRAIRLAVLLRIAVVLHRARGDELPPLSASAADNTLQLKFSPGWLTRHPLSRADLQQERDFLRAADIALEFD